MKLLLETGKQKRISSFGYSGVMGFRMTRGRYSDAVLLSIFKKIFKRLNMIDFKVNSTDPVEAGTVSFFLNSEINIAFAELFTNGFILFQRNNKAIKYIPKKLAQSIDGGYMYNGITCEIFYSDTYEVFGMSDQQVLKDVLKGIDNSLNAAQTVIKRLGVVIVGTPENPASNPQAATLDDAEKEKLEKDTQNDYGMLDDQKSFMFLRRSLKLNRIALGGKDLLITDTCEMFIKIICDAMNIPYDVMAMSGQSTFNNMEQAEKSMQDTAEEFVNKIWTFFKVMGVTFTWTVSNNKYGKTI